jgi:hypothetical protein
MRTYLKQIGNALLGTATLLALSVSIMMVGCDTTVNEADSTTTDITNLPPDEFDARGTLTGRVIDKSTSEPISGVTVSVFDTLSATTGTDGSFSIANVPANSSDRSDDDQATTYNVHISTPSGSAYRSAYTAEVPLVFGTSSSGSGNANNLAANVTFPLSKLNARIEGSLVNEDNTDAAISGAQVVLYQRLALRFDDEGRSTQTEFVQVGDTTTAEDGSFAFDDVEQDAHYRIAVSVDGREENVVDLNGAQAGVQREGEIPASTGAEVSVSVEDAHVPSSAIPPLTATLTPEIGTDFDTRSPTWSLAFNRDVAGVTAEAIEEAIAIRTSSVQTKNLTNGEFAISADVPEADSVSWAVADSLGDGVTFEVRYDGLPQGTLIDAIEGAAYGEPLASINGTDVRQLPRTLGYSIGENENAPAVPTLAANGPNASADFIVDSFGDYAEEFATVGFLFSDVDESNVRVKEIEVFARTIDARRDRTTAGQFEQVATIDPDRLDFGSEAEFDFFTDYPFAAENGDYGPIDVKLRAVSINNVRSDFSSVVSVGDSVRPEVRSSVYDSFSRPSAGDTSFRIPFTEAVQQGPAENASNYVVYDTDQKTTTRGIIDNVSVTRVPADEQENANDVRDVTRVEIELSSGNSLEGDDVIQVQPGVLDLAGNEFTEQNVEREVDVQ